ncbi:MAG: M28 family metallopeptidase [Cyclobacteriaceae bacterium]
MARILLILICAAFIAPLSAQSILGFSSSSAEQQLQLEARFDEMVSTQNIDDGVKRMSARPHYVGTDFGRQNAEWMVEQFKEWGYEAKIETYHVLFPYPKLRLLEMTAPEKYTAKLTAVPVTGDEYTAQGDELLPSYNAFSRDGDVEAELVFVNYGVPADYEELERLGISVEGKIVIAKYYGSWRGIKPKLAAEKGAIGCIIYSDPQDDGYVRGDVYPKGAFKNKTGVQRGSVMDMPLYPGDVLTPGYAATKKAKRLDRNEAPTITKIPVLPISYEDAQPLLAALEGPVAPRTWRGGLPITYHIGPGPAKVHLQLEFDWQIKPAHNVIAKMKGSEYPDQWVIRGNHHDAWVHGAADPVSGMVALMEEARVIGELAKAGNAPKRTVVFCGWDAEEPGLIGSTEWVEDYKAELQEKAVAYINTDGNGRGFMRAGGSHSLQQLVKEVAASVEDPQTGVAVGERVAALDRVNGGDGNMKLYALGSGSDYTPFIQHAGIASINLGYGGENAGGEYHTIYDTYAHYTRFKDPGFAYGGALARTAGRLTLRLANADVIPLDFGQWFITVDGYLTEVIELVDKMRKERENYNLLVNQSAFELSADPTKKLVKPELKNNIPFVNFSPVQNSLSALNEKIATYQKVDKTALSAETQETLNGLLQVAEQRLTSEAGLPRRSWYKHQIYAPGFYTGYGVKTLPAVREAIEQEDWQEVEEQIEVLASTFEAFGAHLDGLNELLNGVRK